MHCAQSISNSVKLNVGWNGRNKHYSIQIIMKYSELSMPVPVVGAWVGVNSTA